MSSIAAQLLAATTPAPEPCLVGRFIATLDDEDRATITAMLARPRTGKIIHRVLTANGLTASASAVRIHRRGDCNCTPDAT